MVEYKKEFNSDSTSKQTFKEMMHSIFRNINIEFTTSTTNPIDAYATAYTQTNIPVTYAFELKEREYDYDVYDDWMIEEDKYETLKEQTEKGYKGMYVNLWDYDDTWHIMVWDINKIPANLLKKKMVTTNKQTVHPEKGKINRVRYFIDKKAAVFEGDYNKNNKKMTVC